MNEDDIKKGPITLHTYELKPIMRIPSYLVLGFTDIGTTIDKDDDGNIIDKDDLRIVIELSGGLNIIIDGNTYLSIDGDYHVLSQYRPIN